MRCSTWKKTSRGAAAMLVAILGLAGLPNQAPAFQFNNGDLVLAIYGNSTEFYYDVGNQASLLAPGAQTTVNIAGLSGAPFANTNVVNGPQTQWTLLGSNQIGTSTTGTNVYAASESPSAAIVVPPATSLTKTLIIAWNNALLSSTGGTPIGQGAQVFLNSTDPAAFTQPTNFNLSGTLGGSWTGGGMQGSLGDTMTMILAQARPASGGTNVLSDVGQVMLALNGQLSICGGAGCTLAAVPLPAGVVLFGTGLIGLVGIARRKLTHLSA